MLKALQKTFLDPIKLTLTFPLPCSPLGLVADQADCHLPTATVRPVPLSSELRFSSDVRLPLCSRKLFLPQPTQGLGLLT